MGKAQRIVDLHFGDQLRPTQIAEVLSVDVKYVYVAILREKRRRGAPVTRMSPKAPDILQLHAQHIPVRQIAKRMSVHPAYAWSVIRRARVNGGEVIPAKADPLDSDETPREAKARVARELAYGKRCQRCWLLLPCDHEEANTANRPPAVTGGIRAKQQQAAGSGEGTLRPQVEITPSGSPASQAARNVPRAPE